MRFLFSMKHLMWRCRTPELGKCRSCSTATLAPKSYRKRIAIGSAIGGFVVGSLYLTMNGDDSQIPNEIPINVTPSRRIKFASDNTGLKLTLYQYQTCPFCCKVRAFLNYHGISYDVVEVNPVLRQQTKFSTWKKVPILIAQDKSGVHQLNDSSMIISSLQTLLLDNSQSLKDIIKNYPMVDYLSNNGKEITEIVNRYFIMFGERSTDKTDDEMEMERKWRMWADKTLVHTLSPNIYRTIPEAIDSFRWFSEAGEWDKNFSAWERYLVIYVGAVAMYFVGQRLKTRHSLKEDVRESIYDACRQWMREVGQNPFRGGEKPDLSDLAVYGMLSAIEGCETFKDIVSRTRIGDWYVRVQQEVDSLQTRPVGVAPA